jgi:hypothetical protein
MPLVFLNATGGDLEWIFPENLSTKTTVYVEPEPVDLGSPLPGALAQLADWELPD